MPASPWCPHGCLGARPSSRTQDTSRLPSLGSHPPTAAMTAREEHARGQHPKPLQSPHPNPPQWLTFRLATTSGPSVLLLCPQRPPLVPSSSPDLHTEPTRLLPARPWAILPSRQAHTAGSHPCPNTSFPLWSVGSQTEAPDGHAREVKPLLSRARAPVLVLVCRCRLYVPQREIHHRDCSHPLLVYNTINPVRIISYNKYI